MNILQATHEYERWSARQVPCVPADLRLKHDMMAQSAFSFLRATCYRWLQIWPKVCADLTAAPALRAVADLHVENFGTWRDSEGRLIWGINDFDEACVFPYASDLVRLVVSAKLAGRAEHLAVKLDEACDAVLTGYLEGLRTGGRPFVLSEQHAWLREIATNSLRDPVKFWKKMTALPIVQEKVPQDVTNALEKVIPEAGLSYSLRRRVSGLGSLGRPRFVALAEWHGGKIAREAKRLMASAGLWAQGRQGGGPLLYQSMLKQSVRCRDPFVGMDGQWLLRRLSPYCSRIEVTALPRKRDEGKLLYAMGWETANVHLGDGAQIKAIQRDLAARKSTWLRKAAKAMTKATLADWKDWAAHDAE
ncbi:MAG: hypothetical protein LZF60_20045 [Nitrospira sp.]|nr:MAG: hypothetical protein LZF60_20045 [Nitrospira sp.]